MGAAREVSEERLKSVREASEARPGGVRGASGRRPGAVRKTSKLCPKNLRGKTGCAHEKSSDSARSCLTFSVRTVKLLSVVDDVSWRCVFDGMHDGFPRCCKTTAFVQKVENRRACAQELHRSLRQCPQNSSFEFESCVFAVPVQ